MNRTKIEWCEMTWNPVTGCLRKCPYCYAATMARRFEPADVRTAREAEPVRPLELHAPETRSNNGPFPFGFEPTFHKYRLDEPQRDKHPRMIFVCSMGDLFGPWVPDEWIHAVFDACEAAPWHLYMFLTKYPERYSKLYKAGRLPKKENWWYGSTITDSEGRRFPGTISLNTFLSIEPLHEYLGVGLGSFGGDKWIIVGAETGNRKGKIIPEKAWVDNIVQAARITRAAVFMKDSLLPIMGKDNMSYMYPREIWEWMCRREAGT